MATSFRKRGPKFFPARSASGKAPADVPKKIENTFQFQVKELVGWVSKSNADFVILGGDFNTDPKDNETSYHDLKSAMTSSMEEYFLYIKVQCFLSYLVIVLSY